ncbi:MAG: hypothetical protein IKL68_02080 [Clostridia bacterium]|nr:hypothetical protein [Clostridia bacterium]
MTDKEDKAILRLWQISCVLENSIEKARHDKEYAEDVPIEEYIEEKNAIDTVLNLLEKKDKIINEIISFIEVFELDSEIAKTYCGETIKKCKHIDEDGCSSCIKEYFINKVEKENKDE